ncbi:MAG TPA: DNA topoisomerase III, partial [Pontiellaceae bacterium]|nr:DNA topoisomerase III [Pontiellaceae bacterium]
MKVVIAEKPSVARELAAVLNITTKKNGYIEGRGCAITWAFGHLVALQEPGDYDSALKRWSLESLPFIPDEFKLK